jgi:phenylpropionate dioxygenase-like ring-hydroxylating dioxygenase large terminal subunit
VPVGKPHKVTVFDQDYVVARMEDSTDDSTYIASMVDVCPHKKASLSEGRVIAGDSNGNSGDSNSDSSSNSNAPTPPCYFQCAYHGWTFDGSDGVCVDIPQVEGRRTRDAKGNHHSRDKANGQAIPAMVSQGMIWLFVGNGNSDDSDNNDGNNTVSLMERALQVPPPPRIPELDEQAVFDKGKPFQLQAEQVRDFNQVDWTVLLENIMDPDHGIFAHQFNAFDNYIASTSV